VQLGTPTVALADQISETPREVFAVAVRVQFSPQPETEENLAPEPALSLERSVTKTAGTVVTIFDTVIVGEAAVWVALAAPRIVGAELVAPASWMRAVTVAATRPAARSMTPAVARRPERLRRFVLVEITCIVPPHSSFDLRWDRSRPWTT
jgi:hypothetical protein